MTRRAAWVERDGREDARARGVCVCRVCAHARAGVRERRATRATWPNLRHSGSLLRSGVGRRPSPADFFSAYSALTGTQTLPPLFAVAYHQCRWNYRDEKDVETVDSKFEELNFPYDVLWSAHAHAPYA